VRPVNGANGLIKQYGLYPNDFVTHDRWLEMCAFCEENMGDTSLLGRWVTSNLSRSFAFKTEADRLLFKMAFPTG
jgi:hypothetical protein